MQQKQMECINADEDEDTMMSLINRHHHHGGGHSSGNKKGDSSSSDSDYNPPPQDVIEADEEYDKHLQAALIYQFEVIPKNKEEVKKPAVVKI